MKYLRKKLWSVTSHRGQPLEDPQKATAQDRLEPQH
jgi:hypothetical protein